MYVIFTHMCMRFMKNENILNFRNQVFDGKPQLAIQRQKQKHFSCNFAVNSPLYKN